MMTAHFNRRTFFALAFQPLVCASVTYAAEKRPEPFNRIVAIVDGSGSFKSRVADAVARLIALLDQMAKTKVHRWDSAVDHVTIVALDALPAVIWQGSVRDLREMNRNAWTERFKARTDFTGCTDVTAAFRLAAEQLQGDPRYVGKYLFVWSDLVDEAPQALSVRKCRPPKRPSLPPQDFPWDALRDVSVSAFWVPPDQILAWQRAVTAAGLGATFKLYSASESGAVEVAPPPRRELHRTEEEVERDKARYVDYAKRGAGWLFGGTMAVVAIVGGILLAIRTLSQRQATRPAPPPAAVRPLPLPRGARPIPPLPISGPNPAGRPPARGNGRAA